ncbi:MurR/RpiR family transcriptional regulator [Micromonospora arborensis]|uniref:MurR/RpiR family transcriptional regulator n=1 Tax=Micromonospora arborensis TaxID=2116518 RepID=UPI001ABF9506|nr:MurR/RpiR family transcriptional regulator [Micromonospora arborensis]
MTTGEPQDEAALAGKLASLSLAERISARVATMSRAERRVAEFLRTHSSEAIFATAQQIGAATQTSDATVVRTAKTLGYSGLQELRHSLGKQVVAATSPLDQLRKRLERPGSQSTTLLSQVFAEATERLAETARRIVDADFGLAVEAIAGAREVIGIGVGPSELTARYLALKLNRMGRHARSTGETGFRLADDLLTVTGDDTLVLFWPSRLRGEMEVVLDHAEAVGARTVLVSDSLGPLIGDRVSVALPAAHSPGDIVSEGMTTQVLTDALVAGVRAHDEDRATSAHELLTDLRSSLSQVNGPSLRNRG